MAIFLKVGVLFIFFHIEGSKRRPLFFDMLCFGGFIIDCNFFQMCTFAKFGIIKILGLRSQDIVLNNKMFAIRDHLVVKPPWENRRIWHNCTLLRSDCNIKIREKTAKL